MQLATSCLLPLGYKYIPAPPAFPPCCVHRPAIMKQLVDAVLNQNFVHLGTPPDTCTKLSQLYNLLTNEEGAGDMHIIIS